MTPKEATARIIKSRQTLARYADMARHGQWPIGDLHLMQQEIMVLEEIAELHPAKAQTLYNLGEAWLAMIEALRAKMH